MGTQGEIDGLVVRVKVTIDLIAPLDQTNAVQGLWNPSTSSLTRGLGCLGALHLSPLTCRARRGREIDGLVVRVNSYDRFTIAPLDQTNAMPCRGYGILLLVA
jgi:hypothetical protein